ncbi:hypothetical protein [Salibacterium aidingense]|nr:hypothetical protein [Salibacterium aidingense]
MKCIEREDMVWNVRFLFGCVLTSFIIIITVMEINIVCSSKLC